MVAWFGLVWLGRGVGVASKLQSRTAGNRHSSLVVHLKSSQVGQQPWPGSITLC